MRKTISKSPVFCWWICSAYEIVKIRGKLDLTIDELVCENAVAPAKRSCSFQAMGSPGELTYKSDRDPRKKIKIKPLRETYVGVAQA